MILLTKGKRPIDNKQIPKEVDTLTNPIPGSDLVEPVTSTETSSTHINQKVNITLSATQKPLQTNHPAKPTFPLNSKKSTTFNTKALRRALTTVDSSNPVITSNPLDTQSDILEQSMQDEISIDQTARGVRL